MLGIEVIRSEKNKNRKGVPGIERPRF